MKAIKITIIFIFVTQYFLNVQVLQEINGKPVFEQKFTDIVGNPYLYNEWVRGNVELGNTQTFTDLELKYNTCRDEVYYKEPSTGAAMDFIIPVAKFDLNENEE